MRRLRPSGPRSDRSNVSELLRSLSFTFPMVKGMTPGRRIAVLCCDKPRLCDLVGIGGGRGAPLGDRISGTSAPLTLIGNRPLAARLKGNRGTSVPPSLDSSPVASPSIRPVMAKCRRNFLIMAVTATSVTSVSLIMPSCGGLPDCDRMASLGGKLIGLPSNLSTWRDPISARHRGNSRIWFLGTDKTLSDDNLAMSCGSIRS